MSHFSVIVCLPNGDDIEDQLAKVMAPWDEGADVEPYREYEEGGPADFWWARSVRRGADNHARLTAMGAEAFLARHADKIRLDEWRDKGKTVADKLREEAEEWADDAVWAARLGDTPTWSDVVAGYNAKYGHGAAVATVDDGSDSETMFVDEDGRAYTVSTANPHATWDYWRIGGRWREYFTAKALPSSRGRVQAFAGLIVSDKSWDSPDEKDGPVRCDGGPKRLLDFEAMRDDRAAEANVRYDGWERLCADTPVAQSWSHFVGLAEAKDITIEQARERYRTQPRIAAARATKFDEGWGDCIVEEFLSPRDEYVAEARRSAVPGYALVTLDGQWLAPGRMGWFGMSSDGSGERGAYRIAANSYLDDLGPDRYIVVLDCHI